LKEIDLIAMSFGFNFGLRMNIGTLIGGIVGLMFMK
jgi:hypothetical protein